MTTTIQTKRIIFKTHFQLRAIIDFFFTLIMKQNLMKKKKTKKNEENKILPPLLKIRERERDLFLALI